MGNAHGRDSFEHADTKPVRGKFSRMPRKRRRQVRRKVRWMISKAKSLTPAGLPPDTMSGVIQIKRGKNPSLRKSLCYVPDREQGRKLRDAGPLTGSLEGTMFLVHPVFSEVWSRTRPTLAGKYVRTARRGLSTADKFVLMAAMTYLRNSASERDFSRTRRWLHSVKAIP